MFLISYLSDNTAKCGLVKTVPEGNILKITSCSIWTTRHPTLAEVFQNLNLGTEDWHWKSWSSNSSTSQSQSTLENLFCPRRWSTHICFISSYNTWHTTHIIFPNPIVHYDPKSPGFWDIFQNSGILFGIFVVFLVLGFLNRIHDSRLWHKQ